ncbi:MAG: TRAP transporter small permease [Betaproteobacteria bacterium]|nr:MAG: TRAP transporter small permease [Betaproteobacteria bacterium]
MRRFLDRLYAASGALAAVCLAGIAAVMLLQAGMRSAGLLFRGADDIVAWLCAGSAFFALGFTFRHGDLVRVSLLIDRLPARARHRAEIACLAAALAVVGYIAWASCRFVFESWKFGELAQGLIQIPIWIPQMSLVLGALVLAVAVLDDFVTVARGGKPTYRLAEEARHAARDFSEKV